MIDVTLLSKPPVSCLTYILYKDTSPFSGDSNVTQGGCHSGVDNIHGRKTGEEGYNNDNCNSKSTHTSLLVISVCVSNEFRIFALPVTTI